LQCESYSLVIKFHDTKPYIDTKESLACGTSNLTN